MQTDYNGNKPGDIGDKIAGAEIEIKLPIDLTDYSGNKPGDEWYNIVGAEVKFIYCVTGIKVQHHTKHGIEPIGKLKEGEAKILQKARDVFVAELAVAMENVTSA